MSMRRINVNQQARPYLVYDSFTDSDSTALGSHTSERGSGWTVSSGSMSIVSNRARATATAVATIETNQADIILTAVIRASAISVNAWGINFRYTDDNNRWIFNWNATTIELYKIVTGTPTLVDSASKTFSINTDYTVQITCNGNSIVILTDGGSQVDASDGFNNTATKCSMRPFHAGAGNLDCDLFHVKRYSSNA
jgi:hypothetical protein